MHAFSQDWYSIEAFLPPYGVEVCVLYKIELDTYISIGKHVKDDDKINTKAFFFIDFLSPLLVRKGIPEVLFWSLTPEI